MPKPIFIIGSGRSGTSVLTWAIGQHPNIIATPEVNWLSTLASHVGGLYQSGGAAGEQGHIQSWNISQTAFFRLIGEGVDRAVRQTFEDQFPKRGDSAHPSPGTPALRWYRSPGDLKGRWVDGTPANTNYAGVLAEMLPDAKFINLVRNPDDVLRSWLGISWRDKRHSSPRALLKHIHSSTEAGLMAHAALGPDKVLRIMFEDLISKPEETMRRIMHFLEEDYVSDCVAPILSGKMNSSGPSSARVEREYSRVRSVWRLRELRQWRLATERDPDWRIASEVAARKELDYYARYRLPLPGMLAVPSRERLLRVVTSLIGARRPTRWK